MRSRNICGTCLALTAQRTRKKPLVFINSLKMDEHSLTVETLCAVSQKLQCCMPRRLRHAGGRACQHRR